MTIYTKGYIRGVPDYDYWMRQVREGIDYRKKEALQEKWKLWRDFYRGKWPADTLPVNMYFRMLRQMVPQVYFHNPSLSIIATKAGPEQQAFAQMIERVDNKMARNMGTKKAMKMASQTAWMYGTGAVKLGFGAQFTPTPEIFDTSAPEAFRNTITRRVEYNSNVKPNMPWLMSVHPRELIVPKGLPDYDQTPWVAHWIQRPIDDVQSDERLRHTAGLKERSAAGNNHYDDAGIKRLPGMIDLVEIRDLRTHKVFVFAPYGGVKAPLYYNDDEMQINNRSNIYPVVFNPDDESFWGVSDARILQPAQEELNEIRTLMMKHRRISLVKLLYKRTAIATDQLENMETYDVGLGVAVDGDLADVEWREPASIPESLFAGSEQIQADIRDQMGFSRNQGGEYQSNKSHNAPTAVEARIVQAAANIRLDDRRDILADTLVHVFEDMNALLFENWQDDQVVQVMGPDAVPLWVAFKPSMLKSAEYEIDVEPDNTLPETKDMRRGLAIQAYGLLKDNPLIDPELLTSYLLRNLHGVQFDHMLRAVQQMTQQVAANQAQGMPGSSQANPMQPGQYVQHLANAKQKPPQAG